MRTLIMTLLFVAVASPDANCQAKKAASPKPMHNFDAMIMRSSREIKAARPEVRPEALACDRTIIMGALPGIKEHLTKSGFSEMESKEAALDGWKIVRLSSKVPNNTCMDRASYDKLVFDLGKLRFTTTPDAARIEVQGKNLSNTTNCSHWFEPRTYHVKYVKDGYEPAELECTAVKGKSTNCHANLKKN